MKNNACCDSADRSCRIIYIHNKLVAGVGKGGGGGWRMEAIRWCQYSRGEIYEPFMGLKSQVELTPPRPGR